METAVSIALGIGLSAAAGFRVFVPLLTLSIASLTGFVELSGGFAWIGTVPALVVFSTATVLEVLAYAIPWVDNLMDSIATPAAVVAGVVATASVITDLPPLVQWVVALIGGGGAAGVIQGASAVLRLKSTMFTGGLANPLLAAGELAGSVFTSILAIAAPVATCVLLILLVLTAFRVGGDSFLARAARGKPPPNMEVHMDIIWTIAIGLVAGAVAKFVTPGKDGGGFILTAVLGIAGAIVANVLGRFVGWYGEGEGGGFIASVVGAIIILLVFRLIRKPRSAD